MNYGQSEVSNLNGAPAGKYFKPGINKAAIKEVKFESLKEGSSPVLVIVITDGEIEEKIVLYGVDEKRAEENVGKEISRNNTFNYGKKEFKVVKGQKWTKELAIASAYYELDLKIKHIISKFTEDTNLMGVTDYKSLTTAVRDKLKPFYGVEIEWLFSYDKTNYTHIYKYVPFCQKIGDNVLEKSYSYSKVIWERPDTAKPDVESEFTPETSSSNFQSDDDLPF